LNPSLSVSRSYILSTVETTQISRFAKHESFPISSIYRHVPFCTFYFFVIYSPSTSKNGPKSPRNIKTYRKKFLFLWWDLGFNSGLYGCKAGTLLLEPHLQPILLWLFWRWGSHELFARAGLKLEPSGSQPPK
jgi:hypothetical protein